MGSILVYQPFLLPFSFLILFCIHTSHIRSPHNYYLKPFVMWLNHGEALFEKLVPVYSIRMWYMGSLYMFVSVFSGRVHYMWECVLCTYVSQCAHVVYVHVCDTVHLCVSTCGMYICVCVRWTWCVYVYVHICMYVCVVYVMSMFLCGEVCGGLCDGYGVCVWFVVCVCVVSVCTWWTSACGEVCGICV